MNALIKAGSLCPVPQAKIALYVVGGVVTIVGIAAKYDRNLSMNLSKSGLSLKMTR